jgi:uncharacterized membrane protein
MGAFIDEKSNIFSGLNKTPTIIIETGLNTIPNVVVIENIIIFNNKAETIRINFQKLRISTSSITMNYTKYLEVKGYQTVDLLKKLELEGIKLYYQINPEISDKLICFSDSSTQSFDCEVNYNILKETFF